MDKINRIAANLGVDEVIATAVQEHLKRIGEIPADEPGETDAVEGLASPTETDAGPRAGEAGRGATGGTKRGGQLDVRLSIGPRNLTGEFSPSKIFLFFSAVTL